MQLSTRCAKATNQQGTKTSTTTHLSKAMRRKANNKIQDYVCPAKHKGNKTKSDMMCTTPTCQSHDMAELILKTIPQGPTNQPTPLNIGMTKLLLLILIR